MTTLYVFGLNNSGSICFFNTAIQALLSCRGLNAAIEKAVADDNMALALMATIIKKYRAIVETVPTVGRPMKPIDDFTQMLCTLFTYSGRQEDTHDTIMYLLDMFGPTAAKLFTIRYKSEMHCRACNAKTEPRNNDELFIDIPEHLPDTGAVISSQRDMMDYIKMNHVVPEDYKCEKCGRIGQCMQSNSLARLPRTIMMLFKKYTSKNVRYFPLELKFGRHTFGVVAQIEHIGGMNGGHYYLKAMRRKPPGIQRIIEQKVKDPMQLQNIAANPDAVFIIDDQTVNISLGGFIPTRETYIVFYELCSQ